MLFSVPENLTAQVSPTETQKCRAVHFLEGRGRYPPLKHVLLSKTLAENSSPPTLHNETVGGKVCKVCEEDKRHFLKTKSVMSLKRCAV